MKNAHLRDAPNLGGRVYSPRVLRQKKADQKRGEMARLGAGTASPENVQLFHCDFRELDAKLTGLGHRPGDVSLVWADPPWDALAPGVLPAPGRVRRGVAGKRHPGTTSSDAPAALVSDPD